LSTTGISSAVAYSGGGYTITNPGAADNLGHLITFLNKTANDHSAKTLTIIGTSADDKPQTETAAGPAGSVAITFVKYYKTVTSITISSTTGADTFDIGWTAAAVGATVFPDYTRNAVINAEIFCRVAAGSPTYSVQYSADATVAGLSEATNGSWLTHNTITGKTATFDGQLTFPVLALRIKFTAAGTVNMTVIEPYEA